MDYSIGLSASGKYIHVVPMRPAGDEAEVLRRWSEVAEFGRKERVYKILFDHRQCAPPANVDLITTALQYPGWQAGERWRIAMLLSQQLANSARLHLEGIAEIISAIQQDAEVFWELERAEEWLSRESA